MNTTLSKTGVVLAALGAAAMGGVGAEFLSASTDASLTAAHGLATGLGAFVATRVVEKALVTDSRVLTARDVLASQLPMIGTALALGLTQGWAAALLSLLTGPVSSILSSFVPRDSQSLSSN